MDSSVLLVILLSIRLFSPPPAAADPAADRSALLAFRSAVGGAVLPWNASSLPCQWKGVTCSGDRVTSLRLPGFGLVGQIPTGTLGNLSELRTLSLRYNAFSGPLPFDLAGCTKLRLIFLNRNRFSGGIPSFLASLAGLIRLNLADNNFSGEIPLSLNNLTRLSTLYLEKNNLSGEMPDLDIPKLAQFNVSFNRLTGPVPAKLRGMPANSFLGTSMCGGPLMTCPAKPSPTSGGSSNLSGGAITGIVIGSIAVFLLIIGLFFLFFWRQNKEREASSTETRAAEIQPEAEPVIAGIREAAAAASREAAAAASREAAAAASSPSVYKKKQLVFLAGAPRVFELEDLLRASAEILGKGSSGIAYKAVLETDLVVAVRRLRDAKVPENEFVKKVEAIGAMVHPNLLPLRAYYYSREEKLLIYDYMPTGSLFSLLHGTGRSPLKWETRISIALDTARGIEFIHSSSPTASHGNIKSSNILITSSFEARVSDHGITDLVPSSAASNPVSGYLAPEAIGAQRVTPKADVFSFGVLLLELVTRKAPALRDFNRGDVSMPRWVETVIRKESIRELFDFELVRFQTPEEEMAMLLQVGIDCCSEMPGNRPEMTAVTARIEGVRASARRKDRLNEKERVGVES